jgi:DNA cross-link repair 1A protein
LRVHCCRSWWPAWRCLPGTSIIVDAFGQSSKALGSSRTWVLTHFHADHYMGLGKGFKQGRILCTPTTAALVRLKLRVPEQLLVALPLGQEITVEGEGGRHGTDRYSDRQLRLMHL